MIQKPHYPIEIVTSGKSVEIEDTQSHLVRLRSMFQASNADFNEEFEADVTLVPEPDNPRNKHAISVRWWDYVIGYLPASACRDYAQLRRVDASGYDACVKARVKAREDRDGARSYSVQVILPTPELLLPLNNPPADGFALLPLGSRVQVTKESDHIEYLADFVPIEGEGQLLVSLHTFEAGRDKRWTCVEVRLEGERIGELTKTTSEKFAPAVEHFEECGLDLYCRAIITGSSVAAEVVLYGAKAHELSDSFLEAKRTKPLVRLVEYQPDTSDYQLPSELDPESSRTIIPLPLDKVVELIPSRSATVETVGEFAYQRALDGTPNGFFDAELIPEVNNPYDPHAISVRYQGETIAYIPRGLTDVYWQAVAKVVASGAVPMVDAKKYRGRDGSTEVKLYLPEGEKALPVEYRNLPDVDYEQIAGHFRKRTPVFQRLPQQKPNRPKRKPRLPQQKPNRPQHESNSPQHESNSPQHESNLGAIGCGLILLVVVLILIF